MFSPKTYSKYHIHTDTFIDMVHELEQIPERAPSRNDSIIEKLTIAELERWKKLFGFTTGEAGHIIAEQRIHDATKIVKPSAETLQKWP
jgi:hypothetical protein